MPTSSKVALVAAILFNSILTTAIAVPWQNTTSNECRCMPGDTCWPARNAWNRLNATVGGRLIANVPLAHVCHDPLYDEAACNALRSEWTMPIVFESSPVDVMSAWWQNDSCTPFTPREQPCELGNYPVYSIDVTCAEDIASGIRFAQDHNIRLVIKNTGHDFLGKSTGAGSLGLWTHNMNAVDIIDDYDSPYYKGPAVKMEAGVRGADVLPVVAAAGLMVVGGSCPSVGLVGGFTQGGGHSPLTSSFGMGADQVLEWEVVTAGGQHLTAKPDCDEDLYWALSGGGPGTFAVVVSVTVRGHHDRPIGGAAMSFTPEGVSNDTYWEGVAEWQALLPQLVDTGTTASYLISAQEVFVSPVTYPGKTGSDVRAVLKPVTDAFDNLGIKYSLNLTSSKSYYEHYVHYLGPLPGGYWPVDRLMGGRLIPREAVVDRNDDIIAVWRKLAETTNAYLGFASVKSSASEAVAPNAVFPRWRDTVITALLQTQWDYTAGRAADNVAQEDEINQVIVPTIAAVTPGAGVYLNEASFLEEDWKVAFYGENYDRLLGIKKKWDPNDLFYGPTIVGSDAWNVMADGRLCRAEESSCFRFGVRRLALLDVIFACVVLVYIGLGQAQLMVSFACVGRVCFIVSSVECRRPVVKRSRGHLEDAAAVERAE